MEDSKARNYYDYAKEKERAEIEKRRCDATNAAQAVFDLMWATNQDVMRDAAQKIYGRTIDEINERYRREIRVLNGEPADPPPLPPNDSGWHDDED